MPDPRLNKLARTLVEHSCQVKPQDLVIIEFSGMNALPLVRSCVQAVTLVGGVPFCLFHDEGLLHPFFAGAKDVQVKQLGSLHRDIIGRSQCYIGIRSAENPYELADLTPEQLRSHSIYMWKEVHLDLRLQKRWVVLRYPNAYLTIQAEMPSSQFEELYFRVCNVDYAYLARAIQPLAELMERTDTVRITGPKTDLRFSIRGMPVIPCVGRHNIPDGEIFTAPLRESIEGIICFNTPTIYQGIRFENIRLTFERGRIQTAQADFNTEQLLRVLDTDEGARYIGEFALGLNPSIDRPVLDPIFDEKIYGSFHLKPGNAYEDADNGNRSAVHWHLVSMQLPSWGGGEIFFDDVLVRKDGHFVHPKLESILSFEAIRSSLFLPS